MFRCSSSLPSSGYPKSSVSFALEVLSAVSGKSLIVESPKMISVLKPRYRAEQSIPRNNNIGTCVPYRSIGRIRDLRTVILKAAEGERMIPRSLSPILSLTWHARTSERTNEKHEEGYEDSPHRRVLEHRIEGSVRVFVSWFFAVGVGDVNESDRSLEGFSWEETFTTQ